MIRLNLGSGALPLPGYLNLDINENNPVYPLPYEDSSVDEIRASHILEHFSHREAELVIAEWTRVIKPNGTIKIAVPDFRLIAECYLNGLNPHLPIEGYLMGGQVDEHDYHKSLWDEGKLTSILTCLGYVDIVRWRSEITDCASLPISLNLKGTKSE